MSNDPQFVGQSGVPQPKTSGLAITSLVLGLLSFFACLCTGVPAVITGAIGLGRINRSGGALRGKGMATAGIILGSMGILWTFIQVALLLPALQSAREAARRGNASNELREISLGILGYANAKGHLPAPASYDAAGKPLLSWRVHILPYLEQQALYQQFHLDEPWDSPHNKTLLAHMPAIYGPGQLEDATATRFLLPTGPGSLFPGNEGPQLQSIADGPHNTILVVEADDALGVPWTAPRDYQYNNVQPRAGLGKLHPSGFLAVMADGSVQHIDKNIPDSTLLLLFNPADNSGMTVEKATSQAKGK